MRYVGAFLKAVFSALYWITVFFAYYSAVAGDRFPQPRNPTFLETYGRGIIVLAVSTAIFGALIYLNDRRRKP